VQGDELFEWMEITTPEESMAGKRVMMRGRPLNPDKAKLESLKAAIESKLDVWEVNPQWLRSLDVVQVIREVVRQHG
jgi:hypothetical protein